MSDKIVDNSRDFFKREASKLNRVSIGNILDPNYISIFENNNLGGLYIYLTTGDTENSKVTEFIYKLFKLPIYSSRDKTLNKYVGSFESWIFDKAEDFKDEITDIDDSIEIEDHIEISNKLEDIDEYRFQMATQFFNDIWEELNVKNFNQFEDFDLTKLINDSDLKPYIHECIPTILAIDQAINSLCYEADYIDYINGNNRLREAFRIFGNRTKESIVFSITNLLNPNREDKGLLEEFPLNKVLDPRTKLYIDKYYADKLNKLINTSKRKLDADDSSYGYGQVIGRINKKTEGMTPEQVFEINAKTRKSLKSSTYMEGKPGKDGKPQKIGAVEGIVTNEYNRKKKQTKKDNIIYKKVLIDQNESLKAEINNKGSISLSGYECLITNQDRILNYFDYAIDKANKAQQGSKRVELYQFFKRHYEQFEPIIDDQLCMDEINIRDKTTISKYRQRLFNPLPKWLEKQGLDKDEAKYITSKLKDFLNCNREMAS